MTLSFAVCANGHFFDGAKNARCPFCDTAAPGHATPAFTPPVGWLVITDGPLAGRDFTLKSGANDIGRDANHAISLSSDFSVAERKHATLSYDAGTETFSLRVENGTHASTLNERRVLTPITLKIGDKLRLGATSLVFIPLVGERFKW